MKFKIEFQIDVDAEDDFEAFRLAKEQIAGSRYQDYEEGVNKLLIWRLANEGV